MDFKRACVIVLSSGLLGLVGAAHSAPAFADTPGQERREDRGEARDVRCEGRHEAREAARNTRRGGE